MRKNQTKYSFLLPAYKPEFFEEALESIKSQTFTEFKVLVSDDCSPYDLKSIFDKVCEGDERFAFRRNKENMGGKSLVSHWNLLLDMCDTEYLILASDDDVYEPTFLEEVDKLAKKYPMVDLIRARVRLFHGNETLKEDSVRKEFEPQIEFMFNSCKVVQVSCIANYVFRRTALQSMGGFYDFPLAWGSDDVTAALMSENGVAITGEIEFYYRHSGKNISTQYDDRTLLIKLDARKKLYVFYRHFFDGLKTDGSIGANRMLGYAKNTYLRMVYETIINDFQVLSFSSLIKLFVFFEQHHLYIKTKNKIGLIRYWFRKRYLNSRN